MAKNTAKQMIKSIELEQEWLRKLANDELEALTKEIQGTKNCLLLSKNFHIHMMDFVNRTQTLMALAAQHAALDKVKYSNGR